MSACDKELTEEFRIDNEYSEDILVTFENKNGFKYDTIIKSGEKDIIVYINKGYGSAVSEFELSSLFKYFEIQNNTTISKMNFLSNDIWEYSEKSDTYSVYHLKIDGSAFE